MLRATNQFIDVLGPGDGGTLRVTSQYIEVLAAPEAILLADADNSIDFSSVAQTPNNLYITQTIAFTTTAVNPVTILVSANNLLTFTAVASYTGPKWFDVTSDLELESTVRIPDLYEESVISNIAFTQVIGAHGTQNLTSSSTIAFSQFADLQEKLRSVTSEVDFTAVAAGDVYKIVGNILTLSQTLEKGITVASFLQPITLVQTVRVNPIKKSLSHTIDFTQLPYNSVKCLTVDSELELEDFEWATKPQYLTAETEVQWYETGYDPDTYLEISVLTGLQDSVTVEKTIGRSATSPVWTSQTAQKTHIKVGAIDVNATSNIAFSTIIPVSIYADASSSIDFTTYADTKYTFPTTEIELNSEATLNKILNLAVSSNLEFVSSFFSVTEGFSLCDYSPFVGSTTDPDAPQRLLKNVPVLDANASGVTLFYPWSVPTTTVALRGPDLGNKNRLEFQRIKRETRGGTLIVWADPMWPKNERLVLSFSGLTEVEGQALLDFIYLTLGKEVGLIDWEGNWWRVVTMTPSESLTRNGRENLSINLEFEMTRSTIRGRSTNEITYVATLACQAIKARSSTSPTWMLQDSDRQMSFARPETSNIDFTQVSVRQATLNIPETSNIAFTTVSERQATLGKPLTSSMDFAQPANQQTVWTRTLDNSLDFTQVPVIEGIQSEIPSNDIDFTQVADQQTVWTRTLDNSLDFTQVPVIDSMQNEIPSNDIDFTQVVERLAVFARSLTSEIEYIEDSISSTKSLVASNEIEYIEDSISSIKSMDADNELTPLSEVEYELV